jgi:hypothetical protein
MLHAAFVLQLEGKAFKYTQQLQRITADLQALQRGNTAAVQQVRQLREQQPEDWEAEPDRLQGSYREQQQRHAAWMQKTELEREITVLKQHWLVQHAATSQQLLQLQQQLDDCQQLQPQLAGDMAAAQQLDDCQQQQELDECQQLQELDECQQLQELDECQQLQELDECQQLQELDECQQLQELGGDL